MGITRDSEEKAKDYDLDEACKFIGKDFPTRNCGEGLLNLLAEKGIDKSVLENELNRQSISNWLNGTKISRESAIKILLTLNAVITDKGKKISIAKAEYFIMHYCWQDGFYERDYKDIIDMFCLNNSLGVKKSEDLKEEYRSLDNENSEVSNIENNKNNLTVFLENKFYYLKTEDNLREFLTEYKDYFGNFNRTAYKEFMYYYNKVIYELDANKKEDIEYYKSIGEGIVSNSIEESNKE